MKLKSLKEIKYITQHEPLKFGLVGGYYDLLHSGHADFLEKCRSLCDSLIVYIHNDETARNIKGPGRPIVSAYERAKLLSKLESTDYILIINEVLDVNSIANFDHYILKEIRPSSYICVKENDDSLFRIEQLSKEFPEINIIGVERQSDLISTTILEKKILTSDAIYTSPDYILRIERTTDYKVWIEKLKQYSEISDCGLAHVSAIIINNNLELGHGINNSVSKCWCQSSDSIIDKYSHPKCRALHAEQNAIIMIIKSGRGTLLTESTIITEKSPCFECAKLIIHVGIKTLIYMNEYTESDGRDLLISNGVTVKRYIG